MKFTLISAIAASLVPAVNAGCQFEEGNNYCNAVNLVNYNSVGFSGSYNRVTSFNDDGSCSSEPQSFSGSLSPLNEELSVHFRGPIALKQFAVYYKGGNNNQKRSEEEVVRRAHHVHKREAEPVYVTDYVHVTKTVYGNGDAQSTPAAAPPAPASSSAPQQQGNVQGNAQINAQAPPSSSTMATSAAGGSSSSAAAPSSSSSSSSSSSDGSGWSRTAYYKSGDGKADGLVFMNNMGGSGSGVWDSAFGNSISYAGSDGTSCASSPQVLKDTTLESNKEFMIFSDSKCSGNNQDCGYYRPGIPAHHGFDGDTKMFLFEFSMPKDSGNSFVFNYDMPAIWFLNAQIPRTVQYGPKSCSCWSTGCGEFDAFEVLNSGNDKLTSHLHTGQGSSDGQTYGGGGTPDYFDRPTDGTLRAAVVFEGDKKSVTITKVDGDGDFSDNYSDSDVSSWQQKMNANKANVQISG